MSVVKIVNNIENFGLIGDSITFVVSFTYQLIMSHVLLKSFPSSAKKYFAICYNLGKKV